MTYEQLESFMAAINRDEPYVEVLARYNVTYDEVMQAIDNAIASAERGKAEAIMKLIKHRQSKVQYEDKMANEGYPSELTADEIKNQSLKDLRAQLAGATTDRVVTINPATAAVLLELLPEPEEDEEDK